MAEQTHWSRTLTAIAITAVVLATIFFLLRVYSRCRTSGRLRVDDVLMGIGLVFSWGLSTCTLVGAYNGIGYDIRTLPVETRRRVTLNFWLAQKFWVLAHIFVKVSIIMVIHQLLGSIKFWHRVTIGLIVFTVAWALTALLGNTFQCIPPQYFWNKTVDGSCVHGGRVFFMFMGSFSLIEDAVLLLIPIFAVWKMNLDPKDKIQVIVLLSCGGLVCVFSGLRLQAFQDYDIVNLSLSGTMEGIWTILEINVAIICASVIFMRPLFRACSLSFSSAPSSRTSSSSSPFVRYCCYCWCIRRSARSSSTSPSSEQKHFFQQWPHKSGFSHDMCSEVRAHAYSGPATQSSPEHLARLDIGDIMVQTSIDRDVQDREAVLATVLGDTATMSNGSQWSSRAPSVA